MKRSGWSITAATLAVALAIAVIPTGQARAESGKSSIGAGVTIGLMFAVVVVYGLVSLRSDIERYSDAGLEEVMVRAARTADESPLVLQALTAPVAAPGLAGDTSGQVAGAAVGWRITF